MLKSHKGKILKSNLRSYHLLSVVAFKIVIDYAHQSPSKFIRAKKLKYIKQTMVFFILYYLFYLFECTYACTYGQLNKNVVMFKSPAFSNMNGMGNANLQICDL